MKTSIDTSWLAVDRSFLIANLQAFVYIVLFNFKNVHKLFDHQAAYFFISSQFERNQASFGDN